MRVFVSEFVCGGAWPEEPLPPSLPREGRAMLFAVLRDLSRLRQVHSVTTWNSRLGTFPAGFDGVTAIPVDSPDEERRLFRQLAAESDAALIIAPEFDGLLTERCRMVRDAGCRSLNCTPDAVDLCGDKLRLAAHLHEHHLPTIPTAPLAFEQSASRLPLPCVIKPRDGAGSLLTFRVTNTEEWHRAREQYSLAAPPRPAIVQPYVPGMPLSMAVLIDAEAGKRIVLPLAEQWLSRDGRFTYQGGRIPARVSTVLSGRATQLVCRACETIPGLNGYVGFDLLSPQDSPESPLIVEINPRLTTSYLGYRQLAKDNLMEWILWPERRDSSLDWENRAAEFTITEREDRG